MAISGSIKGIKTSAPTREIVKDTLSDAAPADRARLSRLFAGAASSDGNRHLSLGEAEMVRDAYAAAKVGGLDLGALETTVEDRVRALFAQKNPDGVRAYFSASDKSLDQRVLEGFDEVIAKANGRPVELNIMIFAFTDPEIAKGILERAAQHENVEFRLIADFAQLTTSGGRKPSYLANEAKKRGLSNIHVKFKKDGAFSWNAKLKRPVYNHGLSKGLNHHKGYVALIDGQPVKLMTGSFNWSDTAQSSNFENLFEVDGTNPANRGVLAAFQAEFVSFYNHEDTLSQAQAEAHKRTIYNALRVANGEPPYADPAPAPAEAPYVPRLPGPCFDINDPSDAAYGKLRGLLKDSATVRSIVYDRATYGAFTSFENLLERVSKVQKLDASTKDKLRAALEYGDGRVPINSASASELMRGLKITKTQATAILAQRAKVGDFESVSELASVPGISASVFARIAPLANDDVARAYFSAKGYDDASATTGYAPENAGREVPVMGADGKVEMEKATLSAGVVDLFRRAKPGQTVKLALYGLSASTTEYQEMIAAATRGVAFEVVLDKAGNAAVAKTLAALGHAGLPISVRLSSKTMHMKFGVVGDDLFQGSANFSGSASSKHSEDRMVVKNNAELAATFEAEFATLWAKSKPV